jgi:hypothetical protein
VPPAVNAPTACTSGTNLIEFNSDVGVGLDRWATTSSVDTFAHSSSELEDEDRRAARQPLGNEAAETLGTRRRVEQTGADERDEIVDLA